MRTIGRWLALGLALVAVAFAGLLGYGLTSEYGATPNGGGTEEAVGTVLGLALPLALVVAALTYAGTGTLPLPRRQRVVVGAAVVGVLVAVLAVLLGSLALDQRCAQRGPQQSAACPGFTGPG